MQLRLTVAARGTIFTFAVWALAILVASWWSDERAGRSYGGDFVTFYAAGAMAKVDADGVYDRTALSKVESRVSPGAPSAPFHYPPPLLAALRVLAKLPYFAALVVWTAASAVAFLAVTRLAGADTATSLALALPALAVNAIAGQAAGLVAFLALGSASLLTKHPLAAGVLAGGLAFKPHFVLVVGPLLVLRDRQRGLMGAAGALGMQSLAATLILGGSVWWAFATDLDDAGRFLTESAVWERMPSVAAALLLAGCPTWVALTGQGLASLFAVISALRVWNHTTSSPRRISATAAATLLAAPYAYIYDFVLLGVPLGLLWREERSLPIRTLLILCSLAGVVSPLVAYWTDVIQIGWAFPLLVLWLSSRGSGTRGEATSAPS
ncbi:MAG: hypothetical protein C0506_05915 [Anaerolinea sp.]|nr:hypothetical protein [Anaerolinea sp.]